MDDNLLTPDDMIPLQKSTQTFLSLRGNQEKEKKQDKRNDSEPTPIKAALDSRSPMKPSDMFKHYNPMSGEPVFLFPQLEQRNSSASKSQR